MAAPGAAPIGGGLATASYERHRPEETVLYTTLQAHWKAFLEELDAEARNTGPSLPSSWRRSRAFLTVRNPGAWVCSGEVSRLRMVPPSRFFMSSPRILPELYWPQDVRFLRRIL